MVLLAGLLVLLAVPFVGTAPAAAADDLLQISKDVDKPLPKPGEVFSYRINVSCSEADCLDAQLADVLPDDLVGFEIRNASFSPGAVSHTVTWTPGDTPTPPGVVTAGTGFTVGFTQVTDAPVGTGLVAGADFTVTISLEVPADYPPGLSDPITNTAFATATNANPVSDSAAIQIDSPEVIDVEVGKSWQPATQVFNPGAASTIGLDARNTSNLPVEVMTLQEPKAAPDGAPTLDPSNPFVVTDFTGFGAVTLPAGCTTVQVDAYTFGGAAWNWTPGNPQAPPVALPPAVTNADVGGIRITCRDAIEPGATLSVDLGLELRATDRNTGADLSTSQRTVSNTTTGSVERLGQSATDDGSASYRVTPLIPTVDATKNITPERITAGQSATGTIGGTNGTTPITTLTIADLGFFTDQVTFGGFTGPLTWPAAATGATLEYVPLNPADPVETISLTSVSSTPPPPTGLISGFTITWNGPIAANETGGAAFTINTSESATSGADEKALTNRVDAEVTAANGLTDQATDGDTLTIVDPRIEVDLDKTIRPSTPVEPGETMISSLATNATSTGDGAVVETITVQDTWSVGDRCPQFWNAFTLSSIAATQVPANTTLTVEVRDPFGNWVVMDTYGPEASATVYQRTAAEVAADLAPGLTPQSVEGIRFTFSNPSGFAADTTVTPNVVFVARGSLRETSCTAPPLDTPVTYTNTATATADGETAGGKTLTDTATDTGQGTVIVPDGTGTGPGVSIAKDWDRPTVASQSDQRASTALIWSIEAGLNPVTITDPATSPTPVSGTVFDAFDLLAVQPVAASNEPYSNGWWLTYDTVTEVALFNGTSWVVVPAPGGTWMTATRGFKGYTLTTAERGSTIAVRITLQETAADTAARQAALTAPGAGFDPFAPQPGSGVGSGSTDRRFDLTWQVRDRARSDSRFVVAEELFNTGDRGVINNTVALAGTPIAGGDPIRDIANDTILILDPVPLVSAAKTVTPTSSIYTPPVGTPAAQYPTATWTITGRNGSVAKASYVRLTDPATCTDTALAGCQSDGTPAGAGANPFDTSADYLDNPSVPNPFQRFTATKITIAASIPAEVDLTTTTVWLLRWNAGTYTTQQTTASAVNALIAAQLANVVGFSVTFQGTDPAADGGTITQANNLTITVNSQLRPALRSTGEDQVLRADQTKDVTNRVFAQSYDPVTSPGVRTGDVADATTQLTGGVINVTPTKSATPSTITQPDADANRDTVTVTLGANQGTNPRSTLSPAKVVIEDQAKSPAFWNAFDFTGLGTVTLPSGADRVQVDLYDGTRWVLGTPGVTATLPSVPFADIQGIRFAFTRADGGLFSGTLPAPNWSASARYTVDLRTAYRDSGEPMEFPSTITNTQTSQSSRPDGNDSQSKDAPATVQLVLGTHELAVNKLTNGGNRLASVGDSVPFDLTLRNVGTGYLTLEELRDVLPEELAYTGDPVPEYTADQDGRLKEGVTLTPSADGRTLTFTWPPDGNVMLPGETFVIRLFLELQPGLGSDETATNTMTVQTEQELSRCTNTQPGGSTTTDWAQDKKTCGTSDFVGVVGGPNLFTVKGVKGSLPGAYNPTNPTSTCIPSLTVDGQSYYRAPCVAHSTLGGEDHWVLQTVNAGTVNVDELTVFDQLPVRGDKLLVTGNPRGSAYRPQIVPNSIAVQAPAGTTWRIEVTSSPDVCVGTWAALPAAEPCVQQGEVWVTSDLMTDWSTVSGIRVRFDFTGQAKAGRSLRPGEAASVTFTTVNRPRTDADPSGASTTLPGADELAWNQFGVKYRNTGAQSFSKRAPGQVGVHLRFGSIQVVKEVTGPATDYAAGEFLVDVECRFGDVALDLGDDATLELTKDNTFAARIDGVPLGSQCTVTEQGQPGSVGETSRSGTPTTLEVLEPTDPTIPADDQEVPEAQIATITNDYQFTGLAVTKQVRTQSTGAVLGPFTFSLTCISITNKPVTFDDNGAPKASFSLKAGETWNAPADRIPVGASCTLAETDSAASDGITFTGDNVVDNGDGTATIKPGTEPVKVEVTNAFDAGTMTLAKVVDGAGSGQWGAGPFAFDVTCTYRGQALFNGRVVLQPNGTRTLGPYPGGTRCTVVESGSAGATDSTLVPADGVVTIPKKSGSGEVTNVTVTARNTFDLTSLDVAKVVTGDLNAPGAAGPFVVSLSCTWLVEGQRVPFAVPGGPERELSAANLYRASYDSLPSSSVCTLTEIQDGGADSTSMQGVVSGVTTSTPSNAIAVDTSATTGPGQALVTVTNEFVDSDISGEGDKDGANNGTGGLADTGGQAAPMLALGLLWLVIGSAAVRLSAQRRS